MWDILFYNDLLDQVKKYASHVHSVKTQSDWDFPNFAQLLALFGDLVLGFFFTPFLFILFSCPFLTVWCFWCGENWGARLQKRTTNQKASLWNTRSWSLAFYEMQGVIWLVESVCDVMIFFTLTSGIVWSQIWSHVSKFSGKIWRQNTLF